MRPMRRKWKGKKLYWLLPPLFLVSVLPILFSGCGPKITNEEAMEHLRAAYLQMLQTPGYRVVIQVERDLPDIDPQQKELLERLNPGLINLEGIVQQSEGQFSEHLKSTPGSAKMEVYMVGGVIYQLMDDGSWAKTDAASLKIGLSSQYFNPEDLARALEFAQVEKVLEYSEEKLVVLCRVDNGYMLSTLEKTKEAYYATEQGARVYDALCQAVENGEFTITSHIYRSSGYLQRQEVYMRLPDAPLLGTIVQNQTTDFFDYGVVEEIKLPEEALKAKPMKTTQR